MTMMLMIMMMMCRWLQLISDCQITEFQLCLLRLTIYISSKHDTTWNAINGAIVKDSLIVVARNTETILNLFLRFQFSHAWIR
jgi:hypothetical protein